MEGYTTGVLMVSPSAFLPVYRIFRKPVQRPDDPLYGTPITFMREYIGWVIRGRVGLVTYTRLCAVRDF